MLAQVKTLQFGGNGTLQRIESEVWV